MLYKVWNITPSGGKSKKRLEDGMERRRDVDSYQAPCFKARNYIDLKHSVSAEIVSFRERSLNWLISIILIQIESF